jgi:hypothetical protein
MHVTICASLADTHLVMGGSGANSRAAAVLLILVMPNTTNPAHSIFAGCLAEANRPPRPTKIDIGS